MNGTEQRKICSRCREAKPISQFHTARTNKFGVAPQCKACRAEIRRPGIISERAERERDRLALAAQQKRRCTQCKEVFPVSVFHVDRSRADGLARPCPECVKKRQRKWKGDNPDGFARWQERNRERREEYMRRWREQNVEYRAQSIAEWTKANRDRVNAKCARRMAAKFQATVAWGDPEAIRAIYAEAARLTAETGIRHEVDHYYPLQGELVCGLHCEANLQILTKAENIRKLNRMPDDDMLPPAMTLDRKAA